MMMIMVTSINVWIKGKKKEEEKEVINISNQIFFYQQDVINEKYN